MDTVAMWIGYAAMAAGGAGLALGALWLAAEAWLRMWKNAMNMRDIMDATAAWRTANPEKFDRWKRRNGIDADA